MKPIIKRIKGNQRIPFIIITLLLTVLFNKIANVILNAAIVSSPNYNPHPLYTYEYTLGEIGLVFIIPAAFISDWLIKQLPQIEYALFYSPFSQKIGVLRWIDRFSKAIKLCIRVLVILSSIIRAIVNVFLSIFRKLILPVLAWIGLLIFALASGGGSSSGSSRRPTGGAALFSQNDQQKRKADAQWEAAQKQKDANVAWKHASNQARYNVNTHHFDERLNRASHKQREADEAAKRARNL